MSTTYRECAQCGKRALSVATRCPQCGLEFPPRPLVRGSTVAPLRPRMPGLALTGLALAAAATLSLALLRGHRGATAAAPASVSPPDGAAGPATTATVDSASAAIAGATATVEPRVSRVVVNWANIRRSRARSSAAVGRLEPGDSVMVDSLSRGWYRVLMDGRPVGYVHRTTLGTVLPRSGP
jgi:hypothetical protein